MSCFPPNYFKKPSITRRNETRTYDRRSRLPRLIGLWPSELEDFSREGTEKILALLRKALRSERARGKAGHWTYDLNRHLALKDSVKAEEAQLGELTRSERVSHKTACGRVRFEALDVNQAGSARCSLPSRSMATKP